MTDDEKVEEPTKTGQPEHTHVWSEGGPIQTPEGVFSDDTCLTCGEKRQGRKLD